jgi:hypothetical protein
VLTVSLGFRISSTRSRMKALRTSVTGCEFWKLFHSVRDRSSGHDSCSPRIRRPQSVRIVDEYLVHRLRPMTPRRAATQSIITSS